MCIIYFFIYSFFKNRGYKKLSSRYFHLTYYIKYNIIDQLKSNELYKIELKTKISLKGGIA